MDVNTVNQTCSIIEHPVINPFIKMMKDLVQDKLDKNTIEQVKSELNKIEKSL
ncbi:MAG: hypothetical protein P8Y70_03710 [Candidatus Lokiarchaeota archaeon]